MAKNLGVIELDVPAIFGGSPVFLDRLPLTRPRVAGSDEVAEKVRHILSSGVLTNGPNVRELESRAEDYLGVKHCIAVSSCTSGLMLVLRVSKLSGDVVLPSFTFAATAHVVDWNGLRPVFADIDPETLTLSASAAAKVTGVRTSAILATHIFGTPADVEALAEVAASRGIRLFFDAAHAFGSRHRDVPIGRFGDAEVFSLSATKVLVAGEGGIIATNDSTLAAGCRIGRDYGNPGDYDCQFPGLNARMSEVHAAIALASLEGLDDRIIRRNQLARLYRDQLSRVPGISFPRIPAGDTSTIKDFTILVDAEAYGIEAKLLASALDEEGIETRRYYSPPVHSMKAYRALPMASALPVTDWAASRVVTLPLFPEMEEAQISNVVDAIERIYLYVDSPVGRVGAERLRHKAVELNPLNKKHGKHWLER